MSQASKEVLDILLVDDDEEDYLIIKSMLKKVPHSPFVLHWVSTAEDAQAEIRAKRHDAYLIDYRLGGLNGLELLSPFNLTRREEPFIILTGAGDDAIERRAMRIGVADYLVKGSFDAELLGRVLRYSIQRKQTETERIRELLEINRSKEEFIALTSHQLRTPATAVKQYLGMVLQGFVGPLEDQQRNFLEKAYESNERQIKTVNDILKVSRLDLKKIEFKKQPLKFSVLIRNILNDLHSVIEDRNQKIEVELPEAEPEVSVDSEHMEMAIGNIIDNASKYSYDKKTIKITVEDLERERVVRVTIADQGVGIAEKDLDKLFKKFSRIANPLSVAVGGNGLGLYWSKEIIELHGGRLDVLSKIGEGTRFVVTMPK
ncbi:response regulator [Candidatus Saccharibacteria bacterium]|nr:response regulator [Candidatus Saccharibacteria bacterium]